MTTTILPREERLDNCIEWLTDLLESNFQQVQGQLADKGGLCCLGVGNTIAHEPLYREPDELFPNDLREKDLPTKQEALNFGLYHPEATVDEADGEYDTLYNYNDGGSTHPEIARMILRDPRRVLSPDIVEDVQAYFTFGEY